MSLKSIGPEDSSGVHGRRPGGVSKGEVHRKRNVFPRDAHAKRVTANCYRKLSDSLSICNDDDL